MIIRPTSSALAVAALGLATSNLNQDSDDIAGLLYAAMIVLWF